MFVSKCLAIIAGGMMLAGIPLAAQQPAPKPRVDKGKGVIEASPKAILAGGYPTGAANPYATAAPAAPNAYLKGAAAVISPKSKIENPTKAMVARNASTPPAASADNPKVPPGKVAWRNSFAVACAAAEQSKKPVLLFHMMGKLDDQFC